MEAKDLVLNDNSVSVILQLFSNYLTFSLILNYMKLNIDIVFMNDGNNRYYFQNLLLLIILLLQKEQEC